MTTFAMVSLDWIWNLEWVGFIGGPAALLFWWLVVKVNQGGIFGKGNWLATAILAPTGVILTMLATYLFFTNDPWRSEVYVVNHSHLEGRLELDGKSFTVAAGTWEHITFRNPSDRYAARGFLGDSMVFDMKAGEGMYMGLLGGDKVLSVHEIVYSKHHDDINTSDLLFVVLDEPGLLRFSTTTNSNLFDFDETPPMTREASSYEGDEYIFKLTIHDKDDLDQ
jgi:hypothetical protein